MTTIFISPHKKIGYLFGIFTIFILLLTIFGLVELSYRTTILVYSKKHRSEINFTSTVNAKILEETVSGEQTAEPKTIASMEDFATGQIIITNNSAQNQNLVPNTRLLSVDNKLFRLTEKVIVLAGQKVEATVKADKPGADYEIGPTTFTLPGLSSILQKKIFAESKESMIGGFKKVGLITQKDIDDATNTLKNNLQKQALENLEKKNNDPGLKIALRSEVISSQVDAKVNDEKDNFTVKMTLKTTAALIKEDELLKTINQELLKQIPSDQKLTSIDRSSFAYRLKSYDALAQQATIEMYLAGDTILSENNNLLARVYFISKTKDQIKFYLQNIDDVDHFVIKISPFFVSKSPSNENRILVKTL
jgi:hypothetical protein